MTIVFKELRKFHNYIKKVVLEQYATIPKTRLLDLACGKGGDIPKWLHNNNITFVKGYDINSQSIQEAKRRLAQLNRIKRKKIYFYVENLSTRIIDCREFPYDIITSNFALHYFFKNESTLKSILQTIQNCSKQGTFLILTLFDGSRIKKSIKTDEFNIKLCSDKEIEVSLKDSVLHQPEIEYLVTPQDLIAALEKISFVPREIIPFNAFKKFETLSENEQLFSGLNNLYVFERV